MLLRAAVRAGQCAAASSGRAAAGAARACLPTAMRRREVSRVRAASAGPPELTFASLDGVPTDPTQLMCSIWDVSFQRGDGVFEAVKVIDPEGGGEAKPRCVHLHLDRMERSAAALELKLPPRESLERWLREAAAAGGSSGYVRCIITRGGGLPGYGDHLGDRLVAPPRTFVMWQPCDSDDNRVKRLLPACDGGWATMKWLAYGPNVHSSRLARQHGFDDALLLARGHGVLDSAPADDDGRVVLDGPNFAVAWLRDDGTFCTPCWRRLGMLQSISCTLAVDAAHRVGLPVEEGVHRLQSLRNHTKAMWVLSTTQEFVPVVRLGDQDMPVDQVTRAELQRAMRDIANESP